MRGKLNQLLTVALVLGVAVASAAAQGTMGMFPRPLGLGALREMLTEGAPLEPAQWSVVMDAHQGYLEQVRRLRDGEIDAFLHRVYTNRSTADRARDEDDRMRLWVKVDAADRVLFDQLQLVLGDSAAELIKSARRTRERRNLLQVCGNWYLPEQADCIDALMNLKLEGAERQAALDVAAPLEDRIVSALRQLNEVAMGMTKAFQREMAAEGLAENWWDNFQNRSPEERESASQRAQQAWRRAYQPIMTCGGLVIREERAALRRLVQCLSPKQAAKLQKLFYSRAYQEMGEVFSTEVERQARRALRLRSLDASQATAVRETFSSWLSAETNRVDEAADLIDEHRRTARSRFEWSQEVEEAFSQRLQKLGQERIEAGDRAFKVITAIVGPEQEKVMYAADDSPELRPPEEVVLVGLEEVDPNAGMADGPPIEPVRDRASWSASLSESWEPIGPPSKESLPSLVHFLGLSDDTGGVVAILLEDAEHARAGEREAWQKLMNFVSWGPDGAVVNPEVAQGESDEAVLTKRILAQRTELRGAATQRENDLWDGVAALLPEDERWRVESVRLARAANHRRRMPANDYYSGQLMRIWPDLAVVATLPLDAVQLRAFCQAAVAAAPALATAATELDLTVDESQIADFMENLGANQVEGEQSEEYWTRLEERRKQRMGRSSQRFNALRTLVETAAEAATDAAAAAGASRDQMGTALRRSSYTGVWEPKFDPGVFINRICAEEVLRANSPDTATAASQLSAQLEPIRAEWAAGHEPCCEKLAAVADRKAATPAVINQQGIESMGEQTFLQVDPIPLRFYRDEGSLRAMEQIALVLGEQRCAALAGFDEAMKTLRKRSGTRSDW